MTGRDAAVRALAEAANRRAWSSPHGVEIYAPGCPYTRLQKANRVRWYKNGILIEEELYDE